MTYASVVYTHTYIPADMWFSLEQLNPFMADVSCCVHIYYVVPSINYAEFIYWAIFVTILIILELVL